MIQLMVPVARRVHVASGGSMDKPESAMPRRALVVYGSKHGATAEIADRIGRVLNENGLPADVVPAERAPDPGEYSSVVIGSAVYAGRWRREAANYLRTHAAALGDRDVWLFSSGPTGEGDPATLLKGWRLPAALKPIADNVTSREVAVFGGAIDISRLGFVERMVLKMVKAPAGDFRDWAAIDEWARTIAREQNSGPAGGASG